MNFRPIAGIDVGKFFSEMAILSPSNEVIARMKTLKEPLIVVMESTGHYHKILFHSLYKTGFEVSVINPIQTDSIKIRKQELKTTNIPDEDIECLRSLCRQYYKLSDELTAYKNRLMGIVDQLMLNFKDVFPNIFSKAALAVLEKYPAPAHILKANVDCTDTEEFPQKP